MKSRHQSVFQIVLHRNFVVFEVKDLFLHYAIIFVIFPYSILYLFSHLIGVVKYYKIFIWQLKCLGHPWCDVSSVFSALYLIGESDWHSKNMVLLSQPVAS